MKLRVSAGCEEASVPVESVVINGLEEAELAGRLASRMVKRTLRRVPLQSLRYGVTMHARITLENERDTNAPAPPSPAPAKAARRKRGRK